MSAALFSAIRGAKTLLVEKTKFVGGTSAFSAGSIWIPNTRHAPAPPIVRERRKISAADRRQPRGCRLSRRFPASRTQGSRCLGNNPEVKLRAYARHPTIARSWRALRGRPRAGAVAVRRAIARRSVQAGPSAVPEFTLLGGMMVDRTDIGHLLSSTKSVKSLLHSAKLLARYARDRLGHRPRHKAGDGQFAGRPVALFADAAGCRYSNRCVANQDCPGSRGAVTGAVLESEASRARSASIAD